MRFPMKTMLLAMTLLGTAFAGAADATVILYAQSSGAQQTSSASLAPCRSPCPRRRAIRATRW